MAAEYFVITDGIDTIEADTEQQVSALRAAAQTSIESEGTRANAVVWRMLDTHVPRKEVAERLGIPPPRCETRQTRHSNGDECRIRHAHSRL